MCEPRYMPEMTVITRNVDEDVEARLSDANTAAGQAAPKGPPGPPRKELPFTPEGKKIWEAYDPAKGDYTGSCLPFGLIRSMNSPDPIQIMQSDQYLALLYEQNTWFKVFHVDGRPHRDQGGPCFGDSSAHWEGKPLVGQPVNLSG